eukprot:2277881-Alexandrium_andersonii.AAC.1
MDTNTAWFCRASVVLGERGRPRRTGCGAGSARLDAAAGVAGLLSGVLAQILLRAALSSAFQPGASGSA